MKEQEGKVVMRVATPEPVRDFPEETIKGWIAEDEADGKQLRGRR